MSAILVCELYIPRREGIPNVLGKNVAQEEMNIKGFSHMMLPDCIFTRSGKLKLENHDLEMDTVPDAVIGDLSVMPYSSRYSTRAP